MNVYKAINAVQKELAREGISKDHRNTMQGYSFRGIDDCYNALSPLLAQHGLCILPRMISRVVERHENSKGTVLFYVTVEAEFDFVCAEDGSKHVVKTFGEAMDSGDKATNKAMSAAYKYAVMQAFAIPTEGDNDADAQTHEIRRTPESFQPAEDKRPPVAPKAPGAYVPNFGKYKGVSLSTVSPDELAGYMQYLRDGVKRAGKPMSPQIQEFLNEAEKVLKP